MTDVPKILDDGRTINLLLVLQGEPGEFQVGFSGITRIVAYGENGDMALVPWLAVYKGEHLHSRIKASACEILYAAPEGGAP